MSFDITLQCFKGGKVSTFPRAIAWKVFESFAKPTPGADWELSFPNGGGGYLFLDDEEECGGFSVNRPWGVALYDAMFEVLRQTSAVVHWDHFVIADPAMLQELPSWAIPAWGPPTLVRSGQEILDAILKS